MSAHVGRRHYAHDDDWDDDYYPNLARPRFRSPARHMERTLREKLDHTHETHHDFVPAAHGNHPQVRVVHIGHSKKDENGDMTANCTVTLIVGCKFNILVDTMTAWDGHKLETSLRDMGILPDDVHYVVCTHGHSDHVGCNYLFQNAFHIVGNAMSHKEKYLSSPLDEGKEFLIEPKVKVICTPGHTKDSVSVLVETGANAHGLVAIAGDLFEREADIECPELWRETAGSEDPKAQEENRKKILGMADYIVPGHGPMFANIYKDDAHDGTTEETQTEEHISEYHHLSHSKFY